MITSAKHLSISENQIDKVMAGLYIEMRLQKEAGEFTTIEFAEQNKISTSKAYSVLCLALKSGRVEKRQHTKRAEIFWKRIK